MVHQRGPTTLLAKRGQIVGLANLPGNVRLSIRQIAAITNVTLSTCADIIQLSTLQRLQTQIQDPGSEKNLCPTATARKGSNQALTEEEKQRVISLALRDAATCRKPLHKLITESGLNICSTTLSNILAADGIHRRRPTQKLFLTVRAKAVRLEWALKYRNLNFQKVLFTDECQFEASTSRSSHAKGVLRRAGEAYLPQNLDRRFPRGSTNVLGRNYVWL